MNPVLHGTLKNVFAFMGNIIFWPVTLTLLTISGYIQGGVMVLLTLLAWGIATKFVLDFAVLVVACLYLATGLCTALVFNNLFGRFKNEKWVYPMIVIYGLWVGIAIAAVL